MDADREAVTHSPDGASAGGLREVIARIIDPWSWDQRAHQLDRAEYWNRVIAEEGRSRARYALRDGNLKGADEVVAKSLTKADEILRALSPSPGLGESNLQKMQSADPDPNPSAHASPLRSAAATDTQCSAGFEVHVLKTHPEPFAAVRARKKWLEIRRHDRNFKEGDTLWLDEYDPVADSKTGEVEVRIITHVLPGGQYGIEPGFCAISMTDIAGCAAALSSEAPSPKSAPYGVFAKAAELDHIAELCGEADDPFAAWETVEFWRTEAEKVAELQRLLSDETSARRAAEATARNVFNSAQDDQAARRALDVVRDVFATIHIDDVASITLADLARIDAALAALRSKAPSPKSVGER